MSENQNTQRCPAPCASICEDAILPPIPERVIFNAPATIAFFDDGTKSVVKTQNGDLYDPLKGFVFALLKRIYGSDVFNDILRDVEEFIADNIAEDGEPYPLASEIFDACIDEIICGDQSVEEVLATLKSVSDIIRASFAAKAMFEDHGEH